jgi:hypothetical protein
MGSGKLTDLKELLRPCHNLLDDIDHFFLDKTTFAEPRTPVALARPNRIRSPARDWAAGLRGGPRAKVRPERPGGPRLSAHVAEPAEHAAAPGRYRPVRRALARSTAFRTWRVQKPLPGRGLGRPLPLRNVH